MAKLPLWTWMLLASAGSSQLFLILVLTVGLAASPKTKPIPKPSASTLSKIDRNLPGGLTSEEYLEQADKRGRLLRAQQEAKDDAMIEAFRKEQ